MDSIANCIEENGASDCASEAYIRTNTFTLKLNGQSRHLDGQGIDRDYLMNRLMPMMHSNTSDLFSRVSESSATRGTGALSTAGNFNPASDLDMLSQMVDRKEIYVFPFALNPEGPNPSGSVNFSKVSHAKLDINLDGCCDTLGAAPASSEDVFQFDVYGTYYNWLAIKDGRALTSFA